MPRRLSTLMASVFVLGLSQQARAQASASFPEDDAPPPRTPAPTPAPSAAPRTPAPSAAPPPPRKPAPRDEPRSAPAAAAVKPARALEASRAAAVWLPPVLPAYAGVEAPAGYRTESHANRGLLWGGGMTLGVGYAAALGYGMSSNFDDGLGVLAVPVFGPWLALSRRDFTCGPVQSVEDARACQDNTFSEAKTFAVLATVGLVQAVGGTLFLVGLFDRRHQWVREDVGVAALSLDAVPLPGGGGAAHLRGQF